MQTTLDGTEVPVETTSPAAQEAAGVLSFFVEGRAQTAGSKRAVPIIRAGERVGTRVIEDGDADVRERKKSWRAAVADAARLAVEGQEGWPVAGAVEVAFVFYRRRPKTHYGSGRNADVLKASAPAYWTTRPDALKLARAAEDALTGVLWHDDSAIVDERLRKVWGAREGVAIAVRRLPSHSPV
jgi:crossover junction endodeoxyribonuclease RusA